MFASALLETLAKLARSSTAHKVRRLSPPNRLMLMAISDSSIISWRLLDARTRGTIKRKRFLRLDGLRYLTIFCEFLISFEDLYFFRKISLHSLVGLDNGAMLLLGGIDSSYSAKTGIWQLKEEQWSRIGEFSKV